MKNTHIAESYGGTSGELTIRQELTKANQYLKY